MQAYFSRQILLNEIGHIGQDKIANANVLIIGLGGLGAHIAQLLIRAGLVKLALIDYDVVTATNLNRQLLYSKSDLGKYKVQVAKEHLGNIYEDENQIEALVQKITKYNVRDIIAPYDYIVDATDNYETRYLINDACVSENKPWISSSIQAWNAQIAFYNLLESKGNTHTYRCVFPEQPELQFHENCDTVGALGASCSIVSSIVANELLLEITNKTNLRVQFLNLDLLNLSIHKFLVKRVLPQNLETYVIEVGNLWSLNHNERELGISSAELNEYILFDLDDLAIDVTYYLEEFTPMDNEIYVFTCAGGKRSRIIAKRIKTKFPVAAIFYLQG